MNREETTIAILGENVPYAQAKERIDRLYFSPDNPRVYAEIRRIPDFDQLSHDEKRDRIYKCLLKEPSVINLEPEIRRDGGLHDPIIVQTDTYEVIEGNSRLAVYRKLRQETRDDRWDEIDCLLIESVTFEQKTRILSQAHLKGRTDWSKYARALLCFRWIEEEKKDISLLAATTGITASEIKKNVQTIKLMNENNDEEKTHLSYYDVLVRNRIISPAIKDDRGLKKKLFSEIKGNDTEGFTAQKMRDQLKPVIAKPRVLKKFVNGSVGLEEAYDRAKISDTHIRLKKILANLDDIEQGDISGLERNDLRAIEQTARKIKRTLRRVTGMINTEINSSRN